MSDQTPNEPMPPSQQSPAPQYQPQPQQGYGGPPVRQGNGLAVAGMVLGIIGVVFAFIPFLGVLLGIILGLLALVLGGVGLGRAKDPSRGGRGQAITGVVLGIVALGIVFLQAVVIGEAANELDDELQELQDELDSLPTEF